MNKIAFALVILGICLVQMHEVEALTSEKQYSEMQLAEQHNLISRISNYTTPATSFLYDNSQYLPVFSLQHLLEG